jgi:hypothetical protein
MLGEHQRDCLLLICLPVYLFTYLPICLVSHHNNHVT